jgi:hypothetical protein
MRHNRMVENPIAKARCMDQSRLGIMDTKPPHRSGSPRPCQDLGAQGAKLGVKIVPEQLDIATAALATSG